MRDHALTSLLWPDGNRPDSFQVYALLDGARDDAIVPAVAASRLPSECLFAGALAPELALAAPYLVQVAPESAFFATLCSAGWPAAWGLYAMAPPQVTLQALRRHFRTLLRVRDEHGRTLAFRFYDPRVARTFLPTCSPQQVMEFFGPVHSFVMAAELPRRALRFTQVGGRLDVVTVELGDSAAGSGGLSPARV